MYKIQNKSKVKVLHILGKEIPREDTEIESLIEFFKTPVYNGKKQTERSLFDKIKKSYNGQKIILEQVGDDADDNQDDDIDDEKKEYFKSINKMKKPGLLELAKEKEIEVPEEATRNDILKLLRENYEG